MKVDKSWVQAVILILAIMGGISLVNKIRDRRISKAMGESEATILARKLETGKLPAEEVTRINKRLAAAGWKAMEGKAIKA